MDTKDAMNEKIANILGYRVWRAFSVAKNKASLFLIDFQKSFPDVAKSEPKKKDVEHPRWHTVQDNEFGGRYEIYGEFCPDFTNSSVDAARLLKTDSCVITRWVNGGIVPEYAAQINPKNPVVLGDLFYYDSLLMAICVDFIRIHETPKFTPKLIAFKDSSGAVVMAFRASTSEQLSMIIEYYKDSMYTISLLEIEAVNGLE